MVHSINYGFLRLAGNAMDRADARLLRPRGAIDGRWQAADDGCTRLASHREPLARLSSQPPDPCGA
jgi:hypothetical protein